MQDLVKNLFEKEGIDGRLGFTASIKDVKCSEPGCFEVVLRTSILNKTEIVLLTALHKQHAYLMTKPLSLGEPDLEDITMLDIGSENLDLYSDNVIIRLKANIMKQYIDKGLSSKYPFSTYCKTYIESLIEINFPTEIQEKEPLKKARRPVNQDEASPIPSEATLEE